MFFPFEMERRWAAGFRIESFFPPWIFRFRSLFTMNIFIILIDEMVGNFPYHALVNYLMAASYYATFFGLKHDDNGPD